MHRKVPLHQRHVRPLSACVIVLMALGGCSGPQEASGPAPDGATGPVEEDGRVQVPRPEWNDGQSWTYRTPNGTYTGIVAREGDGYEVRAADAEAAFEEAYVDELFLGAFEADLSGTFRGEPLRLFEWPLRDGAEWDAAYLGRTLRAQALFQGHWTVEYFENDEKVLTVAYSDNGWPDRVSEVVNGQEVVLAELTGTSMEHPGPAYTYDLEVLTEQDFTMQRASFGAFSVGEETTDLLYIVSYTCGTAAGSMVVKARDDPGGGVTETLACPGTLPEERKVLGATPGPWIVEVAMSGEPQAGSLSFHALVLGRTLSEH